MALCECSKGNGDRPCNSSPRPPSPAGPCQPPPAPRSCHFAEFPSYSAACLEHHLFFFVRKTRYMSICVRPSVSLQRTQGARGERAGTRATPGAGLAAGEGQGKFLPSEGSLIPQVQEGAWQLPPAPSRFVSPLCLAPDGSLPSSHYSSSEFCGAQLGAVSSQLALQRSLPTAPRNPPPPTPPFLERANSFFFLKVAVEEKT